MILYALLISIQSCIDVAHHLVAQLGLRQPGSYREAFEILQQAGYLEEKLSQKLGIWQVSETFWSMPIGG